MHIITAMSFIISANGGICYLALRAYTVELMVDGVIHLLCAFVSKIMSVFVFVWFWCLITEYWKKDMLLVPKIQRELMHMYCEDNIISIGLNLLK